MDGHNRREINMLAFLSRYLIQLFFNLFEALTISRV